MPFGKFKGVNIIDIPTNYLCYAIEEFELPGELRQTLKLEVFNRLDLNSLDIHVNYEALVDFKNIYRKLSVKYHPDRGGSEIEMKVLNEFKDLFFNKKPF